MVSPNVWGQPRIKVDALLLSLNLPYLDGRGFVSYAGVVRVAGFRMRAPYSRAAQLYAIVQLLNVSLFFT